MTKISTYVVDDKVTALDKWIGSDANMQNKTKNFTPKKLAAYFNENQVINIGIPLQYKYYTLDPLEQRPNGTLTFETEIGPTVNFSSITTFLLSKYTTKQNIVSDFLNFLDGSKVLLFKSSDINSFGFYRVSGLEPYEADPNFFVVTVDYETGNGALEEDEDYMISLVSLAGDFIPTKTSELINDGDDGVNPFISELDIDRTEWDAAYEGKINSAEVTGDTTKTLTLTKQDGSTIEASWTDDNTDAVTSVFGRDGDVVAENGDYTTDQVTEVTNKKYQTDNQDLFNDATSSIQTQLNNKEPNITPGTSTQYYRGDKTFQTLNTSVVPEGSNMYLTNARVINSLLTGYNPASGSITSSDSLLTAIEKISGNVSSGYVPYTGATGDVNLGIHQLKADSLAVSITSAEAVDIGGIVWNPIDGTFDMGLIGGVTLQAGQELHMYGKATEAISNGQAVMFAGVQGDHILIAKADATIINANPEYFIGIATQNFSNNQFGYVTVFGNVRGLNTTAYTLGSVLYYNSESSTDGLLTATEPTAPNAKIIVAAVVRVHANQGILLVRPHVMPKLKDIQDVYAPSPLDKNGLFWNNANSRYENNSISGILGYTPANDSSVVKLTGVQTIAGIKTFSESTKFDYGVYLKQDGVTASFPGYTTIDGITNGYVVTNGDARTAFFNLANVTSLVYTYPSTAGTFALTSDLHSPVTIGTANGLSLSGQQLSLGLASSSTNGALSSTDWNSFNSKQSAGSYITSLTGEATAAGPGAASVTLNNASVTAKILSGVNITGGTILDTDTMLTAFGKLQNQINSLIGGSIYQGVWNASTNTPTLTSSVGTDGNYYIVNVAGNTNLNGITDWNIGDWAIFHGGTWQKVDNTDAVSSVNGFTGAVSLTTSNIPEGPTNFYYTDARSRSALSFTAGSGAYNSTTGVITIPTNTSQLTNGANFITLASLSGTAPIQYNNTTGAISITQSGTASNGYLSSTDWTTFNNKLSSLSGAVLTTTNQNVGGIKTFTDLAKFTNGTGSFAIEIDVTTSGALVVKDTGTTKLQIGKNGEILAAKYKINGGFSSQFLKANGDLDSTIYTPASRTLTINGTSYDLSANRSWTIPTHDAVTISTSGAINGLSIDGSQQLSITTASSSSNGALSYTDWTTFNNKLSSLSGAVLTTTNQNIGGYKTFTEGAIILNNASNNLIDFQISGESVGNISLGSSYTQFTSKASNGYLFKNSVSNNSLAISDSGNGTFLGSITATSIIKSGGTSSQFLKADGSVDSSVYHTGSLATNYLPKATGSTTLGNSLIYDNGTNVGIGTTTDAGFRLDVNGTGRFGGSLTASGILSTSTNHFYNANELRLYNSNNTNWGVIKGSSSTSLGDISILGGSGNGIFVASGGNVGIGTASPNNKLSVFNTLGLPSSSALSEAIILVQDSGSNRRLGIGSSTSGQWIQSAYPGVEGAASNLLLNPSGGNVGIGTISPGYKLDLLFSNTTDADIFRAGMSGVSNGFEIRRVSSNFRYLFNDGNVGIGTTSPGALLHLNAGASNDTNLRVQSGAAGNHAKLTFSNSSNTVFWTAGYRSGTGDFGINYGDSFNSTGLTINTSGNVGIGTTSPSSLLNIEGASPFFTINKTSGSTFGSTFKSSGTTVGELNLNTSNGEFRTSSGFINYGGFLTYYTDSSERMRIFSSGNVFIGSSPSDAGYKLDVNGSGRFYANGQILSLKSTTNNGGYIEFEHNSGGSYSYIGNAYHLLASPYNVNTDFAIRAQGALYLTTGGYTPRLTIASTGAATFSSTVTATGFFNSSDNRLKEIVDYDYSVSDIKPISYLWKDLRDNKKHVGYSAQEVQKVMPDAVNEDADGMLSVNYIEVLVAKIAELENRIKQLEK